MVMQGKEKTVVTVTQRVKDKFTAVEDPTVVTLNCTTQSCGTQT